MICQTPAKVNRLAWEIFSLRRNSALLKKLTGYAKSQGGQQEKVLTPNNNDMYVCLTGGRSTDTRKSSWVKQSCNNINMLVREMMEVKQVARKETDINTNTSKDIKS